MRVTHRDLDGDNSVARDEDIKMQTQINDEEITPTFKAHHREPVTPISCTVLLFGSASYLHAPPLRNPTQRHNQIKSNHITSHIKSPSTADQTLA